jgi:SAM-dependent methyltransferase
MTMTDLSAQTGEKKVRRTRHSTRAKEDHLPDFERPGFDPELYVQFRHNFSPETYDLIQARSGITEQSRMLDLACGPGIILDAFQREVKATYGLDQSMKMLRHAHTTVGISGKSGFLYGDGHRMPFAAGSFDLVTIGQAIHWFDLARLVPELHRVLAPGGWLAILSRYPAPEGFFRFWVERLTDRAALRSGKPAQPQLVEIPGISNVLGLEGNGFIHYRREVFPRTVETPAEVFIQGYLYRARGRALTPEAMAWLENQLRTGLAERGAESLVVEPFLDFVITAQKQ